MTSRGRWLGIAGVVVLWALWFAPALLTPDVPFRRDTLYLYLPIRQFVHDSFRAGRWPMWFPYEGLGVPFIGQIVTATFHPETYLFLPFAPAVALKLNILAAYLLALAGGYRFSRTAGASRLGALCGGAALAFSGYALSMSDNLPYLVGLATLPWAGWAALRLAQAPSARHVVALGFTWALVLLAGDAQSALVAPLLFAACFTAAGWSLRGVQGAALAGALAVLLGAVEWLPATVVYRESARLQSGFIIDAGRMWSFEPLRLIELFIAHFLPDADRLRASTALFGERYLWASNLFSGGVVMALAVAARSGWRRGTAAFGGLAVIALWLAFGARGHLLTVLWRVIPPLSTFRFPEKYFAFTAVALVPLVARGADVVRASPRLWARRFVVTAAAAGTLALLVRHGPFSRKLLPSVTPELSGELRTSWSGGLTTTATAIGLLGLLLWIGQRSRRAAILLPVAVSLELWFGNHDSLPLAPTELLPSSAGLFPRSAPREPDGPPPRVASIATGRINVAQRPPSAVEWLQAEGELLRSDTGALAGISTFGTSALPGQSQRTRLVFGPRATRTPELAPLFGACARVIDFPAHPEARVLAKDPFVGLDLVAQACRAPASMGSVRAVASPQEAADALSHLGDNESVWEHGLSISSHGGTVDWESWEPGHSKLVVRARDRSALIVSESFAPGWSAMLDGRHVPIYAANGIAMGLEIPPGAHDVELRFWTPLLGVGAVVSLAGLVLAAVLAFAGKRFTREHTLGARPTSKVA